MKKTILIALMLFFSHATFAQEEITIDLAKPSIDIHDKESIKRGAKYFSTICMACHTMIYMRYDKIAQESGVIYERMPVNVKKWPNNITPPDLSLEANRRGVDWIYTYLHSFYSDPSRPTGGNNLLVNNTGMADILAGFQGKQVLSSRVEIGKKMYDHHYQWYDLVDLQSPGTKTPEEFDAMTSDIVNFLQYAANPYQVDQERIGKWVIAYLIILFVLMYLLKRSYWKKVEKK